MSHPNRILIALLAAGCMHGAPPARTARITSDFDAPLLAVEASGRTLCAIGYAELVQCARMDAAPMTVHEIPGTEDAITLAMSSGRACVTNGAGEVRCWPLGEGFRAEATLVPVADAAELALAPDRACARTFEGEVYCWSGDRRPTRVRGIDDARSIAAVDGASCALRAGGNVACWGSDLQPSPVPGVSGAIAIGGGPEGTFAVADDGAVYLFHHFGGGTFVPATEIARVPNAVSVEVGDRAGCVQTSDRAPECWEGLSWRLWSERSLQGATSIAVGEEFACGVREDGHLRCVATSDAPASVAERAAR